jgi:hypothetical protein
MKRVLDVEESHNKKQKLDDIYASIFGSDVRSLFILIPGEAVFGIDLEETHQGIKNTEQVTLESKRYPGVDLVYLR